MGGAFDIVNLLSALGGVVVLVACVLLWLRSPTAWVMLALAGQAVSVLCRFAFFVPNAFAEFPALRLVWPVGAFVFGVGLVGYAWTEYEAAQRAKQGVQS